MNPTLATLPHGGLSNPSKMPGFAYGIPAHECKTGSVLRQIDNSVCSKCYALKGRYGFSNVQTAQYRRFDLLIRAVLNPTYREQYIAAFVESLAGERYFRWHDSGDIQSPEHLAIIVDVCRRTPRVKHWIPTREKAIVKAYLSSSNTFPRNLCVRISAAMIGDLEKPMLAASGVVTSSVGSHAGKQCHAKRRDGHCGNCRACWNPRVTNVDYPLH